MSEPQGLAGKITDLDLALAALGGGLDPKSTPLGEVMSEGVITCDIGADLDEVVRLMREQGVRRIPITENDRLVGLVTFDDLVVDGAVKLDDLRSIATAQLEVERRISPRGCCIRERGPASSRARSRPYAGAGAR